MNRKHLQSATVITILVFIAIGADTRRPAPRMNGSEFPLPPQQHTAWETPKTSLPETLTSATVTLFDQGMADPRGCEYCEVEIGAGSVWGGSSVVKTRAWVLPAPKDVKQQFGVAWNGLVYPLVSVGEPANLRDDILAILRADDEMLAKSRRADSKFPYSRMTNSARPEAESLSHTTMLPLKACLLLRLGEKELAEKYWTAFTAAMPPNMNNNRKNVEDPYLMLAWDWTWALFDRAVCAHMRGDDSLALASCRALEPLQALVDAAAGKRGFKQNVNGSIKQTESFLSFLQPLARLREDQERRAKESASARPAAAPADAAGRIRALIHDLQDVAVTQSGQPGGISLSGSSIVAAIVKEGEEAVEPLLQSMESDKRLTRSVSFHRDFFPQRNIHPVNEAAFAAVSQILELKSFGPANRPTVAAIRAVWEKSKGKPASSRWLSTLADDSAGTEQWLEAAGRIVQPVDVEVRGGWISVPQRKPGEIPVMRGEALRAAADPSVSELMARRAESLSHMGRPGSEQAFSLQKAADMALCLAKWDAKAAIPVLRQQFANCISYNAVNHPTTGAALTRHIFKLALAGHRAGDPEMLGQYGKWIAAQQPSDVEDDLSDTLEPLWRYADNPAMIQAAKTMFGDGGAWRSALAQNVERGGFRSPLSTPLIALPPVRAMILQTLKDQSEVGTASVQENQLKIIAGGAQTGMGLRNPADPLAQRASMPFPVRACDMLALDLSWRDGTPLFEIYWPREQRDKAMAHMADFLTHYGERYQYSEQQQQLWEWPDEADAMMTFPALDHPATAEEARDGRAIFSLAGEKGEVRQYKLRQQPLSAKWITLKDFPIQNQSVDPQAKKVIFINNYDQEGHVWQAEEIRTEKGWQRFYGFVGRYIVAKVPAEEIDFIEKWYLWGALSGRFDMQVEPPGVSYTSGLMHNTPAPIKAALKVTVRIRNRSGIEQDAPTEFYRGGATPAIIPALRVELSYAPPQIGDRQEQYIDWQPVQPLDVAKLAPTAARKALAPAEAFDAFTLDLHQLFNLDRPGRYRLIIHASKDSGMGDGDSNEAIFSLIGG